MAQNIFDSLSADSKARIIQEFVPGKQVTLAHIIANPDQSLYAKLGLDPTVDYRRSAIGIINVPPAETTIIAGDIATKASGVQLGFVDRFSGTLIVTGTVSEAEAAMNAIVDYAQSVLGFAVCPITKT
ncbi:MAG TPA: propanediol utilization protein [Ruminococcaceae bacterium]|nr:propanediol utilization protein [Oscillospiraceae bacterium]